jgi:hypothetical protein
MEWVPPQQHDRSLSIVSKSKWKTNLAAVQGIDDGGIADGVRIRSSQIREFFVTNRAAIATYKAENLPSTLKQNISVSFDRVGRITLGID